MPLNFPTGPTSGATYTYSGKTWRWNGYAWDIVSPSFVNTLNGLTGAIEITAGSNISISRLGNTLTIASSSTGGGGGGTAYVPLASATVTGVASFGNEFTVSAAGAVGLTSNYVKSVNGLTGAVVSIATTGSNTFSGLQTMNEGLTANNIYVTNGVTFASRIQGIGATFTGTVEVDTGLILPNGQTITSAVTTFNGASGAISYSPVIASSSATGVASFGNEFTVSAAGAVGLTSNYVKSVNGLTGTVVGIATTGSNTFTGLQTMNAGLTANNIYVTNGATFASAIQGTAASFTGLVSSTVGFSGSATNLVGNANGLTVGTASRVQVAEATGTSYYLALAGGTGNTGIFVDTSAPRWTYNPSNGNLETSTGSLNGNTITATSAISTNGFVSATQIISNDYRASDSSSPIIINTPVDDGVSRAIIIGDYDGAANGTLLTISDPNEKIELSAANIDTYGNLNVKNSGYLTFYDADASNYVAFRGLTALAANTLWTLPSADGSANQVLTTNGSGILSWSTPSGGSGGGGPSVTSFNGLTGAVTGVSRVNGLTGGLTFAAGTGITFTTSGNTITIASAPKSTTQTLNFSETINGLEIVFYGTGNDFSTSLQNIETLSSIEVVVNSYGCTLVSIKSFYDATNGWSARLIVKPPFTGNVSAETIYLEPIGSVEITGYSGAILVQDVWTSIVSSNIYHQEETYVIKTVTGQSWVAADSYITCKVLGLTTSDHTPEDAILEGVQFEINNIVAGTGFDIIGHAPEGTYGKYTVKCIEQ